MPISTITISGSYNKTAITAALSTVVLISGTYNLYSMIKATDPGYDASKLVEITGYGFGIGRRSVTPVPEAINKGLPFSAAAAGISASAWYLIKGAAIWKTSTGIALFTASYVFPTAISVFASLDQWRLYEDAATITKSFASAACTAAAAAIITSEKSPTYKDAMALAGMATFPAALFYFNYKTRSGPETESTVVAKAVQTSIIAASAVSLAAAIRPQVR